MKIGEIWISHIDLLDKYDLTIIGVGSKVVIVGIFADGDVHFELTGDWDKGDPSIRGVDACFSRRDFLKYFTKDYSYIEH